MWSFFSQSCPQKGFRVQLALYKDHYIHLYKTKFNSYAVLSRRPGQRFS